MEGPTWALLNTCQNEEDRLGMVESRQLDELPNYEDPPRVEVSTEPPRELGESFRNDLQIGIDAGRVVCFSMRKILKKLKSLCPLSRL